MRPFPPGGCSSFRLSVQPWGWAISGAFLIPYLVALLTAGIPLLFLAYAVGHRFRSVPPLAYRRLHGAAEPLGCWQMLVCFVIAAYYAVIIAWSLMHTVFSFTKA